MENASARNLWGDFLDAHLEFASEDAPKVVHFCDNEKDADLCAEMVCKETKRATTHALKGIQLRNENLPKIGDFYVVTDWAGNAKCIIRTIGVKLLPYFSIREEHARLEGEGDRSLAHWKKVYWDRFTGELAKFGANPTESMIVVFEEFEMLYKK
ncbi:ASCH domain-containing protein [Flagellimonas okinawensis]|uniref:ASCH domain-containing protein n=1 Tax=Flagellimonas okinawensis TaxID=3031324 RepID=A0ABT5XPW8_9FLAO|nr:ASCH domain-containing protein [[Muricauda] okinawensis]MDF0707943.1 ASCH domain-containing protein [[Muricauda] okinawensis]